MRIEPINFARWFESSSNWIGHAHVNTRNRELCTIHVSTVRNCECNGCGFAGDLVSIWGQANIQNELDAVARVVSSAQEVSFPLEALLVFRRIAWVLCTQQ